MEVDMQFIDDLIHLTHMEFFIKYWWVLVITAVSILRKPPN